MTKPTHADVVRAATEFYGDDLAGDAYATKYALRSVSGDFLESHPTESYRRQAREFARVEISYVKNALPEHVILDMLESRRVAVQGSPFAAIGNTEQYQSLSNCFVIAAPTDSYGGIMRADEEMAQIMKRRGGVGTDMSPIRPRGLVTTNAARTTDGIGIFMERFSRTCREVAQGGRRGALMLTCDVHHPEIDTFISIKNELDDRGRRVKVTGANVSVRVSDEFMRAVVADAEYEQRWPCDRSAPAQVTRKVRARDVWDKIIANAHASAEPGVLFWDTIVRGSPADAYRWFRTVSTNPCSELPLCADDSCRLMVLNAAKFVRDPFTPRARFDHAAFCAEARRAMRLMDDLVDLEIEAIERIIAKVRSDPEDDGTKRRELDLWCRVVEKAHDGRRTGLGMTGVGDALAMCGIRYGSDESIDAVDVMYRELAVAAMTESVQLAKERGPFSVFDHTTDAGIEFVQRVLAHCSDETRRDYATFGRRNIAMLTTAPVGTGSLLTRTTSGIEPAFSIKYRRRRKLTGSDVDPRVDFVDASGDRWQEYDVYHPGFEMWMQVTGKKDPEESPYHKATANDVDWMASVAIQAAAQKWIDHAISKTCFAGDTLVETSDGLLYADELAETGSNDLPLVRTHTGNMMQIDDAFANGTKQTVRVTFSDGSVLVCTSDHRFLTADGEWVEIGKLVGQTVKSA